MLVKTRWKILEKLVESPWEKLNQPWIKRGRRKREGEKKKRKGSNTMLENLSSKRKEEEKLIVNFIMIESYLIKQ